VTFLIEMPINSSREAPLVGSERITKIACPSFALISYASAYFKVNKFPENGIHGKVVGGEDSRRELMELVVKHSLTHAGGGRAKRE
jgi:hypothetical protein